MRPVTFALMAVGAIFLVVVAFLNAPFPTVVAFKPMANNERLPTFSSIGPDDPPRPPLTAAETARAHSILAPSCKKAVGAELSRRKLALSPQRLSTRCACAVDRVMLAEDTDPDEGIKGLRLLISKMDSAASQRLGMADATYMSLIVRAEAACAGR
jgi:hypothetical protein